ncbi:MAG: MOSC domain-containing protein [Actinomycetota bacterium]|nr:MOSC domain-containing protein [Actinomycetota bacterium]MEC9395597.1 MOSC domain-containing protein [Actinomycetota bacterium]MED6328040.1 MOSC domain-containing protein [Actinomycetota bacterium]MEE2957909.1 MOSC domain-containing protein [Actinomycetota bacterium]
MAELVHIFLKPAKGKPMQEVATARTLADNGLAGNAEWGGPRQITVLALEDWEAANAEAGAALDAEVRRANLVVTGLTGLADSTDRVLRIGATRLRVTGETRPCRFMDAAHDGLRAAMATGWRGGLTCMALADADVAVGDPVSWEDD